jgi:addiction module RelB/DinJ family antitoxin
MASTTVTMRIDEETKTQLQELTSKLGMDVSTYLLMAVKQGIREQALPFHPSLRADRSLKKEEAFASMEEIVNNKVISNPNVDYDVELASHRDEKYGK